MTLLEQTAMDAARDFGGDKIGAIKTIRAICRVDLRTAVRALDAAQQRREDTE